MLTILSSLDDRVRPKGSRDPLGIEAIWSYMGRKVVGNLTTVTGYLENFIVALMCCDYANAQATELDHIQEHFMRAEQLAAYLKLSAGMGDFLGITRAKKAFAQDSIVLGKSASAQILSDQRSYGLWGLYSSAMEGADLITGAERRLTPNGKEVVQNIITALGPDHWHSFQHLAAQSGVKKSSLESLATAFRHMLEQPALRKVMGDALLAKQKDCTLQSELYGLAQTYLADDGAVSPAKFCNWVLECPHASDELKGVFTRMRDLEPLLVVAEAIMNWLQRENNEVASALYETLAPRVKGLNYANSWLSEAKLPHRPFLRKLIHALNGGDAASAIRTILDQNKAVMQQRGGAPWAEFDHNQQLTVRVRNDSFTLPMDLAVHGRSWTNTYFLGSFLSITKQGMA